MFECGKELRWRGALAAGICLAASGATAQTYDEQSQQRDRQYERGSQYGETQKFSEARPVTRQIDGRITELRRVILPGQNDTWLVACIETNDGQDTTVVLGSEDRLRHLSLNTGDQVNVESVLASPQGRGMFAAQRVSANGQSATMARRLQPQGGQAYSRNINGKITELRNVRMPGQEQTWLIAAIETQEGQPTTVMLGPEDRLQVLNLRPGDQVNTHCIVAADQGRGVFAAQEVSCKGESVTMARGSSGQQDRSYGYFDDREDQWRRQQSSSDSRTTTRQLEGRVTDLKTVSVPGQDRSWVFAAIENRDGQTTTIALGPQDRLEQLDLDRGDHVSVQGVLAAPHGRGLFAAQRVMANGQSITLARPSADEQAGRLYSRQIQGEIDDVKRITLPGQERTWLFANIQQRNGEPMTILLGPEDRLRQLDLDSGDDVSVQAFMAAPHGRGFYAAQQIVTDDGSVTLARGFQSQPEQTFGYVGEQQGMYERQQPGMYERQQSYESGRMTSRRFQGRITELRRVNFPGEDRSWIVAAIDTSDGQTMSVLLGPEDRLQQLRLDEGDSISVDGFTGSGGRLAMAQRISTDRGTVSLEGAYEPRSRWE